MYRIDFALYMETKCLFNLYKGWIICILKSTLNTLLLKMLHDNFFKLENYS